MKSQLASLLECSLSTIDPRVGDDITEDCFAARGAAIKALPNPLKRAGAMAVHRFVGSRTESAYRMYERLACPVGSTQIGEGFEAKVFRQGARVVKLYERTIRMSEAEREDFKNDHERSTHVIEEHLGNLAVPHCFEIGTSPLGNERAVLARQDFINFRRSDSIFPFTGSAVDLEAIELLEHNYPGVARVLAVFGETSLDMYERTRYLPDIYGPHNLVVGRRGLAAPAVHLIDTVPHRDYGDGDSIYPKIVRQLEELAALPSVL